MDRLSIVAPVMRLLGTSDRARCQAFYRDVLGFAVRPLGEAIEAECGPARLVFAGHDFPPLDWDAPQPPGPAMVFFETADVDAARETIAARGGSPGGIERVNGIKQRMFAVRDPDGHTLWFGQSYDEPHAEPPAGQCRQIMPGMPLTDVAAGVAHYRDILGFTVNYTQHDIAVIDRDKVRVLLIARTERHKGIGSAYVYVEDADALHDELAAKGANVRGEAVSRPWGLREFVVWDLEGNEITFGQPFE